MNDSGKARFRPTSVSRRRALLITGAAVGAELIPWPALGGDHGAARSFAHLHRWRGQVLGAEATILLSGMEQSAARRLVLRCLNEAARLEEIFSLYRRNSAVSRLNRDGELQNPPRELVGLLTQCRQISEATGGAFDVTVQALWKLYAAHFSSPGPDPAGPGEAARARALMDVDYAAIDIARRRIAFGRPGISITLNGIAQGYITDRIVDLLQDHGVNDVFVDLGETRALGEHPSGRPWAVGLVDPAQPQRLARSIAIGNEAVASSGGYGTVFDPAGLNHHLFDRFSGSSAKYNLGVTVVAPTATTADALSTAMSVMPPDRADGCLTHFRGARATITLSDGSVKTMPGSGRV